MKNDTIVTLKELLIKREIDIDCSIDQDTLNIWIEEFGIQEIKELKAHFKLFPIANQKGIGIKGKLKAFVVHNCVLTLQPVPQSISEDIFLRLTPNGEDDIIDQIDDPHLETIHNKNDYDVEMLENGAINLNDVIYEYLSLSLFTLPRVANANFQGYTVGNMTDEERKIVEKNAELISEGKMPLNTHNPFAALSKLKQSIE